MIHVHVVLGRYMQHFVIEIPLSSANSSRLATHTFTHVSKAQAELESVLFSLMAGRSFIDYATSAQQQSTHTLLHIAG